MTHLPHPQPDRQDQENGCPSRDLKGSTKVWSCERHADELVGTRRLPAGSGDRQLPSTHQTSFGPHQSC
jgi:hypothetical protein